jgi:hypothetical protein
MRTYSHVIDTRSIKRVLELIPDHWVIRELTERDYGIDLFIEIFEKTGADKNGHDTFDSTGAVFHAQVKGTAEQLKPKKNKNFRFQLNKSAMLYAESFSTPFLLFIVDVSSQSAKSYFLWIQRYVSDVLDVRTPGWRDKKQRSFSVEIPDKNDISSGLEKIKAIASRPRLIQETVDFRDSYFHLSHQLDSAARGELSVDTESLNHMRLLAKRIRNLKVIFKYNNCGIDKKCAEELLHFVESLNTGSSRLDFPEHPHRHNFNLLANSLEGLGSVESFIAANNGDTAY